MYVSLYSQVGVVDFTQYKSHFLATFARSRTSFAAMPGTPSLAQVTSVHYSLSLYLSIYPTNYLSIYLSI